MNFINYKNIHFIGICGIGMIGIAEVLFKKGYKVSGSDICFNKRINRLINLGIKVFFNHDPKNIINANLVVISSAIKPNNPELLAAKKLGLKIFSRGEILSKLMKLHKIGIAVSGTHGKTTTTSMIANIFLFSGLKPTFINGGLEKESEISSYIGDRKYFIAEADESDLSFLYLKPLIAVVTNIELDHINNYEYNFENLKNAFIKFLNNLFPSGKAVVCLDDPVIRRILSKILVPVFTYGFHKDSDFRLGSYKQSQKKCFFKVLSQKYNFEKKITLNLIGIHNALNSVAALVVSLIEKIKVKKIIFSLKSFLGVKRRLEYLGTFVFKRFYRIKEKIILIDDYAHHPTEIFYSLNAIRVSWPNNRIILIFEPHRYSRLYYLYNEFINVLEKVDELLILSFYSANEEETFMLDSNVLFNTIKNRGKLIPILVFNIKDIVINLIKIIKNNDVVLIQGAGDIENLAPNLMKYLNRV